MALTIALACSAPGVRPAKGSEDALRVLTYNDRTSFADPEDAPSGNDWPHRLPLVRRMLKELRPDVVGVQEATDGQIRDLAPGFTVLRKEEVALLYRADRLEALEGGSFELGSYGHPDPWGTRWALWQRFRRRGGGDPFVVFVTHLSTAQDQEPQARLLLNAAREKAGQGQQVLLMGDFNFDISTLLAEYAFTDARPRGPRLTFHAFKGGPGEALLDFIAASGLRATGADLYLDFEQTGGHRVYPSDHYPEWAMYRWPGSQPR